MKFRNKYFWIFFLGEIVLVVIIVFISIFAGYHKSNKSLEQQAIHQYEAITLQLHERIKLELDKIKSVANDIATDREMLADINNVQTNDRLQQISGYLEGISNSQDNIYSIELYLPKQQTLISSQHGVLKSIPSKSASYYQTVESLRQSFWSVKESNPDEHLMTYIATVPQVTNFPQAYVSIQVKESTLLPIMNSVSKGSLNSQYIINSFGKVIYSNNRESVGDTLQKENLNIVKDTKRGYHFDNQNNRMLFINQDSSNSFTNILSISKSQIYHNTNFIQYLILIGIVLIILGAGSFYLKSRVQYRPIGELEEELNSTKTTKPSSLEFNEWGDIFERIIRLKRENNRLQKIHDHDSVKLKEVFLLEMLTGSYQTLPMVNLIKLFDKYRIKHHSKTQVIVIETIAKQPDKQIFREEDDSLKMFSVKNIIEHTLEKEMIDGLVIKALSSRYFIVLPQYPINKNNNDINIHTEQLAKKIEQSLERYIIVEAAIGIGKPCNFDKELWQSYGEAIKAKNYLLFTQSNDVLTYKTLNTFIQLQYPTKIENKIIKVIQQGDIKKCSEYFDEFADYVSKHCYSISAFYHIYYMLLIAIIQNLDDNLDIHTFSLKSLPDMQSNFEIRKWFKQDFFPYVFEKIEETTQGKTEIVIQKIKRYLGDHVTEVHTLNSTAERFGINPSYLSRLFKEVTGDTFVNHLSNIKINKSIDYLLNTDLSISKIAEEIGYSERTFSRTFKKITGLTPAQYRIKYTNDILNERLEK
ncbi:helix-turn-helix domain-containing protein [Alkalihalobacillus sp. TS-13]|uniref:helix-turn-helix domain-containing protein n=1 Tax=Alkalihalobacillus sp. TS-13 TaxID=2842455 RepID=UPI001C87B602|nr:helix-turn-helix domain-containing protein [Alkalihalobacillus sp. TS-13]